jgi:NAD(P)-dependent dehydrogenase (short-subunit alcohol dehydrogenase family)
VSTSQGRTKEVVIVTGASSGIGRAVAEAFLESGASVVGNARDEEKLHRVGRELGAPERLALVPGDVGEAATAEKLVRAAYERFGRLDTVVCNAGLFAAKPFVDFTSADLEALVATNLRGTILLAQAAVQAFREHGSPGAIVSVSAAIALSPQRGLPASLPIAVKGGLNAWTRALALELAGENIRVNAVAPGIIRTPLIHDPDAMSGAQPMGRVGEPREVADAVMYLARAAFVTGVVLPVDGGLATGRF